MATKKCLVRRGRMEKGMDDLAYLRPSIFLKFLSFVAVAVAPEIDVIRQRGSYSRSLAHSHCANTQKRNFRSEQAVIREATNVRNTGHRWQSLAINYNITCKCSPRDRGGSCAG